MENASRLVRDHRAPKRAISSLLAAGLDTSLVAKLCDLGYNLSKLRTTSQNDLRKSFSSEECGAIAKAVSRKPIKSETVARLIEESDWKCCLCWDAAAEDPVIVHHIVEHAKTQDDSYDNLVVLCLKHHALVHSKWDISRHPCPPELLKSRKKDWAVALREFKIGSRPMPRGSVEEDHERPEAPSPPVPFVGRFDLLARLHTILSSKDSKLVALCGMGGIGKSTIARQAWKLVQDQFPGGCLWVDLANYGGSALPVLQQWAAICSHPVDPYLDAGSLRMVVTNLLKRYSTKFGRVLIVLDDIRDEWLESALTLADTLPESSSLLVTTRHATLASSIGTTIIVVNEMSKEEAQRLLTESAGEAIGGAPQCEIEEVTVAVGMLPLGLLLAGKCIQFRSSKPGFSIRSFIQAVNAHADESLHLHGHPGLWAIFGMSYHSLDDGHRGAFRAIGVFANADISLSAVTSVLHRSDKETEALLDGLVAHSLLNWGTEYGSYRLHSLLWQFASSLVVDNSDSFGDRHLEYYCGLCSSHSSPDRENHDVIEHAFPNVLVAMRFAISKNQHVEVRDIVLNLEMRGGFLSTRSRYLDARWMLEASVSACRELNDEVGLEVHLTSLASTYQVLGRIDKAKDCLVEAGSISERLEIWDDYCAQLSNMGSLLASTGNFDLSIRALNQAIVVAGIAERLDVARDATSHLAGVFRGLGDIQTSRQYYAASLNISSVMGDRLGEGNDMSNLGLTYFDENDLDTAEHHIRAALEIARKIGDKAGEANRNGHLGNIFMQRFQTCGECATSDGRIMLVLHAHDCYQKAYQLSCEIGHRTFQANWLSSIGNALRCFGRLNEAISCYHKAYEIAVEMSSPELQAMCVMNLGLTYKQDGKLHEAIGAIRDALIVFEKISSRHTERAREELRQLHDVCSL